MIFKFCLWLVLVLHSFSTISGQPKVSTSSGLFSLAKAYGYLRYFYPGDETAELDWPKFLVYASKEVVESNESGDRVLNRLFKAMAPTITILDREANFPDLERTDFNSTDRRVYWQHLGDGNGSLGYPYKSMRVNRPANVLPESQNDFATLRKSLPIELIAGRVIEFKALFKSDPTVNANYALVLLIKPKGKEAFTVVSTSEERSAIKWCEYSVKSRIPDSIERVTVIVQAINMAGISYVDDISLTVLGTERDSVLIEEDFSDTDTASLRVNWRPQGINQNIGLWKEGENQFLKIHRTRGNKSMRGPLFAESPSSDWMEKNLTDRWKIRWPLVLPGDSLHTYPGPDPESWHGLQGKMNDLRPDEMNTANLYCRLANVMVLWNKIQHFYPEMDQLDLDWDTLLKKAIGSCFSDTTLFLHRQTLTRLLSPLKDGHMTIYYTSLMPPVFYPPFAWEWIEGQLVIVDVINKELDLNPGAVVLKVNGQDAASFWQDAKRNTLGATDSRRNFKAVFESLGGDQGEMVEIEIVSSDKVHKKLSIKRLVSQLEFERWYGQAKIAAFGELKPGVFYIDLSRVTWSVLKEKWLELKSATGIIVDIRRYPQWESINFLGHFTQQPLSRLQYGLPKVLYPDQERMTFVFDTAMLIYPREPFLEAKIVFLTGGSAISYAEDIVAVADHYKLGTIIGEPTAGTTGGANYCYLLGGLQTPWTGIRVLKQDGLTLFNAREGVVPDKIVSKTIENIRSGKDDCIEYCLTHFFR